MKWLLIVLLIIVIILTIRLSFKVDFCFNFFENDGFIKLSIFKFITIFKARIQFTYYYLSLHLSETKTIKFKFDLYDENVQFINDLQSMLAKKIYLITFHSLVEFGLENAFYTALIYGNLNHANRALFFKLQNSNEDAQISMNVLHNFTENNLELNLHSKFIVSLFDLFWAFLSAILNRRLIYNEQRK